MDLLVVEEDEGRKALRMSVFGSPPRKNASSTFTSQASSVFRTRRWAGRFLAVISAVRTGGLFGIDSAGAGGGRVARGIGQMPNPLRRGTGHLVTGTNEHGCRERNDSQKKRVFPKS